MTCRLRLMQGDTLPSVIVTITDEVTGVVDISDPAKLPYMKFRQCGTTETLQNILGTKLPGVPAPDGSVSPGTGLAGEGGRVRFDWPEGALDIPPGNYEGEVSVHEDALVITIPDRIQFVIREAFA